MKSVLLPLLTALTFTMMPLVAAEESPIVSPPLSEDNSPATVEAARVRGAVTARMDIQSGTLRILYFGLPWSQGKPLVDDATGYRVQVLSGCMVMKAFEAEVGAYNKVMREHHEKVNKAGAAK